MNWYFFFLQLAKNENMLDCCSMINEFPTETNKQNVNSKTTKIIAKRIKINDRTLNKRRINGRTKKGREMLKSKSTNNCHKLTYSRHFFEMRKSKMKLLIDKLNFRWAKPTIYWQSKKKNHIGYTKLWRISD